MPRSICCLVTLVGTLLVCGCASVGKHALRESLLRADREWSVAVDGDDLERIVEFWTDDAVVYTPGALPVRGKEALRALVKGNRATPGFSLTWNATEAVVSASGDLGYTLGPYAITVPEMEGELGTQKGHYICVWRREGGAWRCSLEVWAPLPPPGARDHSAGSR